MNIELWEKLQAPGGMFLPPDEGLIVRGKVYGHPEVPDGVEITVNLLGWDHQERAFVTHAGIYYRLKNPSEAYERMFPAASGRLEKAINNRNFKLPAGLSIL